MGRLLSSGIFSVFEKWPKCHRCGRIEHVIECDDAKEIFTIINQEYIKGLISLSEKHLKKKLKKSCGKNPSWYFVRPSPQSEGRLKDKNQSWQSVRLRYSPHPETRIWAAEYKSSKSALSFLFPRWEVRFEVWAINFEWKHSAALWKLNCAISKSPFKLGC